MVVAHSIIDFRLEQAHNLCVEELKNHPNGMIPIQTVYEMLLKIINREDIIESIKTDWENLNNG